MARKKDSNRKLTVKQIGQIEKKKTKKREREAEINRIQEFYTTYRYCSEAYTEFLWHMMLNALEIEDTKDNRASLTMLGSWPHKHKRTEREAVECIEGMLSRSVAPGWQKHRGLDVISQDLRFELSQISLNPVCQQIVSIGSIKRRFEDFIRRERDQFDEVDRIRNDMIAKYPDHSELAVKVNCFSLPGELKEVMIRQVMESVTRITNYYFGIPCDFYDDLVNLMQGANGRMADYIIDQLGTQINVEDPLTVEKLVEHPEEVLPDPEWWKELKRTANALAELPPGSCLKCFGKLKELGKTADEAIALMQAYPEYDRILELYDEPSEYNDKIMDFATESYVFGKIVGLLLKKFDKKTVYEFLSEYGDYQIGKANLATHVRRLRKSPEAVDAIVENALELCCSQKPEEALAATKKGAAVLIQYLKFVDEPYKQLAIIRYASAREEGIENFAESLRRHADEKIAEYLERNDADLIDLVRGDTEETVEMRHPIQDMQNQELIAKYYLVADLAEYQSAQLSSIDRVLTAIKGTIFEPLLSTDLRGALLDQASSRKPIRFIEAYTTGDPYEYMKSMMFPKAEEVKRTAIERVVLFIDDPHPDELEYIEAKTGIRIRHVDRYAAPKVISDTIRETDLVLLETSRGKHEVSYAARNVAARRGAVFKTFSASNKDRIVAEIQKAL
ncbi:hypothetical protein KY329_00335 [Candidatus Woesearchaeota archaeon]|nr:hypothetical protein [Candidatus Woesearchaeota archaeon]